MGVTRGLASLKFSGSPRINGDARHRIIRAVNATRAPSRSFVEKKGWNGILSWFLSVPRGLFDPVW